MSSKLRKSQKRKVKKDAPPTVASTSSTLTQGRDAMIVENAPSLQKEESISSGFGNLQLDFKIWIKYGASQPTRISFDGEIVDDLKKVIKKELSPDLDYVAVNRILLRKNDEEIDLLPDLPVDKNFKNNANTPLQVIVTGSTTSKRKHEESEVLSEIAKWREELSWKMPAKISVSGLSDFKADQIVASFKLKHLKISAEDFQSIEPISCQPFLWNMEIDEDYQMSEVQEWFKDVLNLPRGFYVKDVHTQNYQRYIRSSNVTLTGGANISIGPSKNDCVWIETKKRKENFKEGQAIGKLFLIDHISVSKSYLASSEIDNRGIALAIIKQFVLDEGIFIHSIIGKQITYQDQASLPEPLKKKSKLFEPISEEVDDRMADIIDNMTKEELFNMSMRKKLKLAKSIVRIEEQPIIDQFIRQFSDNYENSPPSPQMFA
ncbi:15303_t:CDS:2 [Cetraspora pellucida]|uniref:15303_t:CDS:1 n=1 Tax=Cetraspora pellucida TaxID=1433469 RepID=A0A9N9IIY2_9GLOM|nr:15303_t:CDS:2 [Cetraspora pellucida]